MKIICKRVHEDVKLRMEACRRGHVRDLNGAIIKNHNLIKFKKIYLNGMQYYLVMKLWLLFLFEMINNF